MAQLIEATRLDALGVTVGFLHIPGAGFRVATMGGGDQHMRHLSIAAARRLASEIMAEPDLEPAAALLREKADRLEDWLEGRREDPELGKLAEALPAEGHA